MAKMGKNEAVSVDVLEKICKALDCNLGDVAEFKWESVNLYSAYRPTIMPARNCAYTKD